VNGDPAEIRKRIQSLRKSLSPEIAAQAARSIADSFLREIPLHPGLKVALYRPLPEELDVRSLADELEHKKIRLFYPRVKDANAKALDFVEMPAHAQWMKGAYGIEEPASGLPAIEPTMLDLIVVPGVAFSPSLERIGRGAGYYDRFLKTAPQALRLALAFDFQVQPTLPQHPEDQKVDWLLTERQDLRNSKVAAWLKSRN
jgi:5-formyltetrahydrofolate cyclo-ligase